MDSTLQLKAPGACTARCRPGTVPANCIYRFDRQRRPNGVCCYGVARSAVGASSGGFPSCAPHTNHEFSPSPKVVLPHRSAGLCGLQRATSVPRGQPPMHAWRASEKRPAPPTAHMEQRASESRLRSSTLCRRSHLFPAKCTSYGGGVDPLRKILQLVHHFSC